MKKRSQMELIGIALIVVLLIFVLFYFISRNIRESNSLSDSYMSTEMAQNLLNSMFKAEAATTISLADCIRNIVDTDNKCMDTSTSTSLDYTTKVVTVILKETLGTQKKRYAFSITIDGSNIESNIDSTEFIPITSSEPCGRLDEKEAPGRLFLPSDAGTMIVKLDICKD